MRRCTGRAPFTLIELLVVVAVIAVLMAILLPALLGAKRLAVRAQCQNNLRQQGLGFTSYADENESWGPHTINSSMPTAYRDTDDLRGWVTAYFGDTSNFLCPAEHGKNPRVGARTPSQGGLIYQDVNLISSYFHLFGRGSFAVGSTSDYWYGWRVTNASGPMAMPNLALVGTRASYKGALGTRTYTMLGAEEQPLAYCGFSLDAGAHAGEFPVPLPYNGDSTSLGFRENNHNTSNGSNFLLADGHLEWRSFSDVQLRQKVGTGTAIGLYW